MSTALYAEYKLQERRRLKRKRLETRVFCRNPKPKTTQASILVLLMNQATNENVALSTRLKLALEMREKMTRLDLNDVVILMRTQQHLVVKLADALLYTSYVPLQQLLFMSLTSLLSTLNTRHSEQTFKVREHFRENLRQLDKVLLNVLPLDEIVQVTDPATALWTRKQVNALNRITNICQTYIVRKCWVSSCGKDKLMPIWVDEWLDFGRTTLTFYRRLPQDTIVHNIPYNCMERIEFVEDKGVSFVFIKCVAGLGGINLVAFKVELAKFSAFRKTLIAMAMDDTSVRFSPRPAEIRLMPQNTVQTEGTVSHLRGHQSTVPADPISRPRGISITNQRFIQPTPDNTAITATSRRSYHTLSQATPSTTVISRPRLRTRTIQNQLRGLLPGYGKEPCRAAFPDSTTDLTRAKAECLKNLKESMGYVDPDPIPRWLMFLIAVLIVVPWGLFILHM